jgi:hypothetical protein
VASDCDAEPAWFATLLAIVLQKAGVEVLGLVTRDSSIHSTGNFICDKFAFHNPTGKPTNGEPLKSVLEEAGIPVGVSGAVPGDLISRVPLTVPIIVIGGRFVVPPTLPFLGAGEAAPPPTMLERIRNP